MNSNFCELRLRKISMLALFAFAAMHVFATDAQPPDCSTPQYRQFDFWAGDWNAYDYDNPDTVVAHLHVESMLNGCVLREDYQDTKGHKGQSFSMYDASRNVWHQSWVTNRGELLVIEGGMQNREMTLSGVDKTVDGQDRQVRGTWKPVAGGVRETAFRSTNGGKTWTPWFDLMLRPASSNSANSNDEKTVAALDTEYQAAVKNNDTATMDRILADNFILVTGRGKVYTKSDLLQDEKMSQYEHNEEADQTVRVWGDTAVITAKLWEKGTDGGTPFDHLFWFSDTYVRTPDGWRYVFGQASLQLPKNP